MHEFLEWLRRVTEPSGEPHGLGSALLALVLLLAAAKLGGHVAARWKQPAVLGELVGGVLVGNLDLLGFDAFAYIGSDPLIDALAQLGVILLLFEVGLESTVAQMARVGSSALLVATLGVIAPGLLGIGVGMLLLPDHSFYVHLFLGATLTATSVGITARVLKDLGESQGKEARVILGAAVIDDVMGLVILAAVTGIVAAADQGVPAEAGPIAWIVAKALLFLVGVVWIGSVLAPPLFRGASRLAGSGVLLGLGLSFCFLLAWLAGVVGLAPIVGAFAAGLILDNAQSRPFIDRGEHALDQQIQPLSHFLAPVFFVLMGFRVDLAAFAQVEVLGLAAALTAVGIIGKQVCMLGVLDRSIRRLPVGIGMIPRGEVGLIFANIGLGLTVAGERIVDGSTFTAVVCMVIVTTVVTPPALAWSFRRERGAGLGAPD